MPDIHGMVPRFSASLFHLYLRRAATRERGLDHSTEERLLLSVSCSAVDTKWLIVWRTKRMQPRIYHEASCVVITFTAPANNNFATRFYVLETIVCTAAHNCHQSEIRKSHLQWQSRHEVVDRIVSPHRHMYFVVVHTVAIHPEDLS